MPAKTGIIKTTTVKAYITKAKKMRTQAAAVKKLIEDFDTVLEAVIVEAVALAKAAKRNTVRYSRPSAPRRCSCCFPLSEFFSFALLSTIIN